MKLKLDGEGALFEQLARAIKRSILDGRLAPGSRLPSTRTFAVSLGVSRNTVLGAYELLCAEQLAVPRAGSGTRVTSLPTMPAARARTGLLPPQSRYSARARTFGALAIAARGQRPRFDLRYGSTLVSGRLFKAWRRKLGAAAVRTGPRYPSVAGLAALRSAICDYLLRRRGVSCSPTEVVVVSGTQQAVSLVARVVLNEGSTAVIEDPHYPFAYQAIAAHGARIVRVPVDRDGLRTAKLPKRPPRLIFVTPSHQFPSGVAMSLARRIELLAYAERHGSWVFEDDYDGDFDFDRRPLPALRSLDLGERVIYVGTFSKTVFPALRLGYIVCRRELRRDLVTAKMLDDLGCPDIEQAALATFMHSGQFEKHLRWAAGELRNRRQALLEGLARHLGDRIEISEFMAPTHIIAWFPDLTYVQLDELLARASSVGLAVQPVHPHYQALPERPGLLLGCAAMSPAQFDAATALLAGCVDDAARVR